MTVAPLLHTKPGVSASGSPDHAPCCSPAPPPPPPSGRAGEMKMQAAWPCLSALPPGLCPESAGQSIRSPFSPNLPGDVSTLASSQGAT